MSDQNQPQQSSTNPSNPSDSSKVEPLIPERPTFQEGQQPKDSLPPTPSVREPTHSKGSPHSGPIKTTDEDPLGQRQGKSRRIHGDPDRGKRSLEHRTEVANEVLKNVEERIIYNPKGDKPELSLPWVWTAQGSRSMMARRIGGLQDENQRKAGYGAAVQELLIHTAVAAVLKSEPNPDQAVVVNMGIEEPATQKSPQGTGIFVRMDLKTVKLPAGIESLQELEIEERKQRDGEPSKLDAPTSAA